MVQYQGLWYSVILKKDVPWQRWLVKNQNSANRLRWKGIIKNVRLKNSQQNANLEMTQVLGFRAILEDMSDILWFDKQKWQFFGLFRAFSGYPAQTPWHPARPHQPGSNCEACAMLPTRRHTAEKLPHRRPLTIIPANPDASASVCTIHSLWVTLDSIQNLMEDGHRFVVIGFRSLWTKF